MAEPKEVELTPDVVVPQSRDAPIQADLGDRAETNDRILPLLFGIDFPEGEDVAGLGGFETVLLDQPNGVLRRDPIEVEKLPLPLAVLILGDGELLLRQIGIGPAVVAARDALGEREVGVDGHELLDIRRHHDRFGRRRQELNLELTGKDLAHLLIATGLFDQSVDFTGSQICGCKIGHRILLGLLSRWNHLLTRRHWTLVTFSPQLLSYFA